MLTKNFKGLGLAMVAGLVATASTISGAQAQLFDNGTKSINSYSCSDDLYGADGSYWTTDNGVTSSYRLDNGTADSCATGLTTNSAGSVVTATATLRAAVSQTVGIVASRIANVKAGNATLRQNRTTLTSFNAAEDGSSAELGLAGGDTMNGMGVWAQGQYVKFNDSSVATDSDGNISSLMAGVDTNFAGDAGIVGVSFGYQMGDITTTFNSGTVDMKSIVVAPYVSYSIDDMFSIDATAGYADVKYENARTDSITSERFTAKNSATRMFGSAMLNASSRMDNITLTGKVGASYSRESQSAFTESGSAGNSQAVAKNTAKLGQAVAGATMALNGDGVSPFVSVLGEYDYTKTKTTVASNQVTPSNDKFGVRLGGGVNIDLGSSISALLEANTVLLRDNYKEHTGTVRIRAEF